MQRNTNWFVVSFRHHPLRGRHTYGNERVSRRPARAQIRASVYWQRAKRKNPWASSHFKPIPSELRHQKKPAQYTQQVERRVVHCRRKESRVVHCRRNSFRSKDKIRIGCDNKVLFSAVWSDQLDGGLCCAYRRCPALALLRPLDWKNAVSV